MIERAGQLSPQALLLEPLLEPMLTPLTDAMGEFGQYVSELCAESVAARL